MKSIYRNKDFLISCSSLRSLNLEHSSLIDKPIPNLFVDTESFILLTNKLNVLIKENAFRISERMKRRFILGLGKNGSIERTIVEILMARRYRSGARANCRSDLILKKVSERIKYNLPLRLTISLFPFKIPNLLKSGGFYPDLGDLIALARLKEISLAVKLIYPPGAEIIVLLDGNRFKNIFHFSDKMVDSYQKTLQLFSERLQIKGYVNLVDYQYILNNNLPNSLKQQKKIGLSKVRSAYLKTFGERIDINDPLKYLNNLLRLSKDIELTNSFIALYMSLLYCSYIPEIMNSKRRDQLSVDFFKDIFCFNNPNKRINTLRKRLVQETWDYTINYISEIVSGRLIKPVEYVYPDSIRCDMHNIPGRLSLYPVNKSTRLSSFHGTGYIDVNSEIGVNFRINLTTNEFKPVYGKIFGVNYNKQAFFYIDPILAKKTSTIDKSFINTLKIK